ncbi:unnamed protein product [Calypogeia fissa]
MNIVSLQLVRTWGSIAPDGIRSALQDGKLRQKTRANFVGRDFLGRSCDILVGGSLLRDAWSASVWHRVHTVPLGLSTSSPACLETRASSVAVAEYSKNFAISSAKAVGLAFTRGFAALQKDPLAVQCVPAVALMAFSVLGLGPTMRFLRKIVKKKEDVKWSSSRTQHIMSSYVRPLLLWIGVIVICRAFDPVVLSSEASHAVKGRFINFVRSLSTVLAFAFCTTSFVEQIQKTVKERQDENSRNIGVQFVGNTVYTSVWVAAVCLFMELLGFSTQKLITAGGFGTVLLTLAGREIFTNFLSSIMIHATRPFVENEWIQTKIEGQEVSGTVEHVGWWSPTIIRGDDREAVHIPNHKFTVSVVRNLSQKTHWRIKTHFGISHLDVGKISDIVSDMRKVISKNPHVEQQRLHRRAFFDNIDPENQSLLILVSCFVKTSHFEEYLRVKEIILLDLLRVISHHNARLATPIRSVQRIFDESEARQSPFRDAGPNADRKKPMYMIEAAAVAVEDADEEVVKVDTSLRTSDTGKGNASKDVGKESSVKEVKEIGKENGVKPSPTKVTRSSEDASDLKSKTKPEEKAPVTAEVGQKSGASGTKPQLEGLDSMGLHSSDITLLKAAYEKPPADIRGGPVDSAPHVDIPQGEKASAKFVTELQKLSKSDTSVPKVTVDTPEEVKSSSVSEAPVSEQPEDDPWKEQPQVVAQPSIASASQKSDGGQSGARNLEEKVQTAQAPVAANPSAAPVPRLQSVEENLVLGVALDGPKRTLPLDDDTPHAAKPRELVTSRNSGGSTPPKERRDTSSSPQPNTPVSTPSEGRDRER